MLKRVKNKSLIAISCLMFSLMLQSDELTQIEEGTKKTFVSLQEQEKKLVDELTEKYGEGSLDPKTGIFKPV